MTRRAQQEFLERGLKAALACSDRLEHSLATLAALFPMTAERVAELSPDEQTGTDALLKRFEQLVTTLQDQVFRSIALFEGADLRGMSKRDVAELMEKYEVISSALAFRDWVDLRNRLAHVYPDDPARQAEILNQVFAASRSLHLETRNALAAGQRRLQ